VSRVKGRPSDSREVVTGVLATGLFAATYAGLTVLLFHVACLLLPVAYLGKYIIIASAFVSFFAAWRLTRVVISWISRSGRFDRTGTGR
jgi:hypothetical protein